MGEHNSLRAVSDEAREIRREEMEKARNPVACPDCGEPLGYNERLGLLGCPFCGYRTPGRPADGK